MRLISDRDEKSLVDLQGYATYCRSVVANMDGEEYANQAGAAKETVRQLAAAIHRTTRPILLDAMPDGYETAAELTIEFKAFVDGDDVRYFLHGVEVTDVLYGLNGSKLDPDFIQQLHTVGDELVEEAQEA
jgi:hypothetical protein